MFVGGRGSKPLISIAWEPPLMCLAWKIPITNGREVNKKGAFLKISFTYVLKKLELWHLFKSLLPSAKGLSIYFYVASSPVLLKSTRWKAHCHLHSLLLVYIGYDLTGSLLPWITMFSQSLLFKVLCIYVLRSQKGLARYHLVISYYDCFKKVLSSEIYYYCSLVDYAIEMSKHET